ncbi:MAG: hypothetical protein EXX96DRAFT_580456 [Benjaminiella poitrasii]|nr:MAG: hypothetical protein EXX96DRAFT_580456 [Benjaminiella poitrasii]
MHRVFVNQLANATKTIKLGFHSSASSSAITRFNLPAMSPTMTEGTIHKWMVKEGDSFSSGDVLLELETDKAQIDVEATEDGVLAKIILSEGKKSPVNSLIALLAEEGDDISNVEIPAEEQQQQASSSVEVKKENDTADTTSKTKVTASPISHHDIDTSKLKKSLSPAVLSLVTKYGIKDVGLIEPSGYGGRILKGDVLAYLGLIAPKPAPKPTLTAAPPRDQIIFAKPKVVEQVKKEIPPTFISKQIVVDDLFNLRQSLNEQHNTNVSVNDFIAKAAERALQDVTTVNKKKTTSVIYNHHPTTTLRNHSHRYMGGTFKIFNLAEPIYDIISDSYENAKPYVLQVDGGKKMMKSSSQTAENQEMLDLIDYLGGQQQKEVKTISSLLTQTPKIDFSNQPTRRSTSQYEIEVKLDGEKVLNNPKAIAFLDRVEYYVQNPNELVAV